MGDDGIVTNYFLSLSLTQAGEPVSQFSVNWTSEDGVLSESDGPPGGVRVPVDDKSLACLESRAR